MASTEQLDSLVGAIEDALIHGLVALPTTSDAHETARSAIGALSKRIPDKESQRPKPEQPDVLRHLPGALQSAESFAPAVAAVAGNVAAVAGELHWKPRPWVDGESPRFRAGHANAHIIGPTGIERRSDATTTCYFASAHR